MNHQTTQPRSLTHSLTLRYGRRLLLPTNYITHLFVTTREQRDADLCVRLYKHTYVISVIAFRCSTVSRGIHSCLVELVSGSASTEKSEQQWCEVVEHVHEPGAWVSLQIELYAPIDTITLFDTDAIEQVKCLHHWIDQRERSARIQARDGATVVKLIHSNRTEQR